MDRSLPSDLLELKARFEAWRRTRISPRAKTPDDLLQTGVGRRWCQGSGASWFNRTAKWFAYRSYPKESAIRTAG